MLGVSRFSAKTSIGLGYIVFSGHFSSPLSAKLALLTSSSPFPPISPPSRAATGSFNSLHQNQNSLQS